MKYFTFALKMKPLENNLKSDGEERSAKRENNRSMNEERLKKMKNLIFIMD